MIYIIRHGQTEQNNRHLLAGRGDYVLNDTGIQQARDAGEWLRERDIRFDTVYSSPLFRARHTAQLVAPGMEILVDERLIETDFGKYEGRNYRKLWHFSATLSIIRHRKGWNHWIRSPKDLDHFLRI